MYRCTETKLADRVDEEGDALHEASEVGHGFFGRDAEDEPQEVLVFARCVLIGEVERHKVVHCSLCLLPEQLQRRHRGQQRVTTGMRRE